MSSTVVPTLRYRDAHRMIGWLCEVFGFARHAVYDDGQGGIAHAQLTLGSGMIMLGSARDDEFGRLQSTPAALGGTTKALTLSFRMQTRSTGAPRRLGRRSSSKSKTRTTAAEVSHAVIRKAISGTSAPTIRGKSLLDRQRT
jgi:hypothetical protein